jgi:glycogen debranching enzyme
VQGYVYEAKMQASELASLLGYAQRARELRRQAQELKARFQQAFWSEDIESYVLALDRHKNPCQVRASSAGHCLFAGIASKNYARKMVKNFFKSEFFTGWGIRTLSSQEVRFNPMSYHNGSVWPHDNALLAYGLARYGFKKECLKIMAGLFDASLFMDLHRLPELFCGFARRPQEGPTLYPVACNPQAWASAAVFMLIQACLGISINAPNQKVYFIRPVLPRFLEEVKIINLKVGETRLDIILEYHPEDVGIKVARRKGKIEIVSLK